MVNIKIQFDNQILTLPVNPEELSNQRDTDNEKVKIVGLGNVVVKKDWNLLNVSIESFFPSINSEFYTNVSPRSCVEFINKIRKSDKIPRITTEGLPVNLNMYFVINEFTYDNKAGEEDDLYYTLDITEYIPYGARIINMQGTSNTGILEPPARVDTKVLIDPIYRTQDNDSVISITRKIVGDTNRWQELYQLNAATLGNQLDNIPANTRLVLPESWVVS